MLDRILGIAGCAFGVAGIIMGAVANKNNKKTNSRVDNIENDINTIKSQSKDDCTNFYSKIEEINSRIDKLDVDMNTKILDINNKVNYGLNGLNGNLNDIKNTINTIDEANQKKFNGIAEDLIGFNKWGKGVNVAIEQLETYAEKNSVDFKPIIKPMLDERRKATTVAVATETPVETTTEKPTIESTQDSTETKAEVVNNKPETVKPETKTTKNKKK